MDARGRSRYEALLKERRKERTDAGPVPIEPNRTDTNSVGVPDEDAQALSEMLQTLASNRNRDAAREVGEIDRALRKLRDEPDDFGLCEDCGDEIDKKRLDLRPWAAFCAECQANQDPKRNIGRKNLTDYK
jgi:DnaK suppressor protein